MSAKDQTVPTLSTLPWKMKIQYVLNLQVSRYCPLVLQSCTVAGVPDIEYRVCKCLPCVTALLVEQGNIHRPTSYYDGPWTLPTSKI